MKVATLGPERLFELRSQIDSLFVKKNIARRAERLALSEQELNRRAARQAAIKQGDNLSNTSRNDLRIRSPSISTFDVQYVICNIDLWIVRGRFATCI